MKTQWVKHSMIALTLVALLAGSSVAEVLHDQSAIEADWTQGFLNTIAGGGRTGILIYGVSDVSVGGGGWIIESITIYVQSLGSEPTLGYLNIFPKISSPLPDAGQIPNQDLAVPVTTTLVPGLTETYSITASGLNIPLNEGDYWIGLTPLESPFFYSSHAPAATQMYDNQASYDASWAVWDNLYAPKDATILVEGSTGVVAVEGSTMGSVKALFR